MASDTRDLGYGSNQINRIETTKISKEKREREWPKDGIRTTDLLRRKQLHSQLCHCHTLFSMDALTATNSILETFQQATSQFERIDRQITTQRTGLPKLCLVLPLKRQSSRKWTYCFFLIKGVCEAQWPILSMLLQRTQAQLQSLESIS